MLGVEPCGTPDEQAGRSRLTSGVVVAAAAAVFVVSRVCLQAVLLASSVHKVPEGYVGVYWRGGALLKEMSDPGFHFSMPLLTQFETVQTTLQTDAVRDIPCGTSGGVMITFDRVEVVNRLRKDHVLNTLAAFGSNYDAACIYSRIHHEINQFCSAHSLREVYIDKFDTVDERLVTALQDWANVWAPGIDIIAVRVTKPVIPERIRQNFEDMEAEKAKLLIAEQKQKVSMKEAETDMKKAEVEATKIAEVSKIKMAQQILEKEAAAKIADIENKMFLAKQATLTDAENYRREREAKANELLLTPAFLELKRVEAIAQNTKIYFGDSIPTMFSSGVHVPDDASSRQE